MKRVPIILLVSVVIISSFGLVGCRDETDPEYNLDLMYDRPWREKALKNITDIYNTTMQENGNDIQNPKVQELVNILVPGLVEGFQKFDRDPFNRKVIIELLAQMNDPRSEQVFLDGLELKNTSDASMFNVAANAVRRQGVEKALPKLLKAYNNIIASRDSRPGAPFTNAENEIAQSFISSSSGILVKNPNSSSKGAIVEALIAITDTPDTLQELRLNMKAMKALGRIGDPAAVGVLIRGIAMKGVRQPIGLGQIAFASLQQIHDRDAVVKGILAFAKGEDAAFNKAFEEELKSDPVMKNPTWFIQQAVTFLGSLNYGSPEVIAYLESELNHTEPDAIDEKAAGLELQVNFEPDGWAVMRRNWAAVSLAQLGHAKLMDVIQERMKFKGNKLELQLEEAVGYIRAMGILLMPEESCPIMLKAIKGADDSLRDKIFYNASLMCGEEFFKPMDKAINKIDCDKIVKDRFGDEGTEEEKKQAHNECDIMKKRVEGYKDRIKFGKECGNNLDCYLKVVADHTNKNVERAITSAYRIARKDASKREQVVKVLTDNLGNPSKVALSASIAALDHLTPQGGDELVGKIQEVYKNFARQSTYKDRARMLEAFIGHVRNRGRK